jgi:hypothetical protein
MAPGHRMAPMRELSDGLATVAPLSRIYGRELALDKGPHCLCVRDLDRGQYGAARIMAPCKSAVSLGTINQSVRNNGQSEATLVAALV